ncbi:MAG: hypothetical protein CVU39_23870 [Chloroflexi bacterium HGW-Chloroflexi-10]|nr:MAG: hypothetical protein CVU39_23870 [Chloroflexi bacterium HGW-Chloroflexi-10]
MTAVLVHEDLVLTEVIIDGEWLETTPEHPFYTQDEGWLPAGDLKTGMKVRKADGSFGLVWLKWTIYRTQVMYNLTVNTAHTYFIGEVQWLVHNICKPIGIPQTSSDPTHAAVSAAIAQQGSQKFNVVNVYLNKSIGTVTGKRAPSRWRPDVTIQYADGSYQFFEKLSRSENIADQLQKIRNMNSLLAKYGIPTLKGFVIK